MRSLQARLAISLVCSLLVLLSAEWLLVSASISSLTEDYVASRLTHETTNLLALITFDSQGRANVDTSRLDSLYLRPFSGHYFACCSSTNSQLRSRSLWDTALEIPVASTGQSQRFHAIGPKGQRLLLLASGFQKQGHKITMAVAEDLTPLAQELHQFEQRYIVTAAGILMLLMAVQSLIVRVGLLPLKRLRMDITRLERGEIEQLDETVPTEVRPLVKEMNRLLQLLAQRLQRSRNALGNLAHALKTPLTLLMQLAEEAPLQALPEVRDRLREHTRIFHHHFERELRRARLAGATSSRQRLLLTAEISRLVSALQRIYKEKALDITCNIPPRAEFTGDREDFLELVGNVLDNACQWASRQVMVTILERPGFDVTIADDGPGCPPEILQQLAQRGVRVDESMPGHGLGLAIVKDIVEQYKGHMSFGQSPRLGGLQVRVILPTAPDLQ